MELCADSHVVPWRASFPSIVKMEKRIPMPEDFFSSPPSFSSSSALAANFIANAFKCHGKLWRIKFSRGKDEISFALIVCKRHRTIGENKTMLYKLPHVYSTVSSTCSLFSILSLRFVKRCFSFFRLSPFLPQIFEKFFIVLPHCTPCPRTYIRV